MSNVIDSDQTIWKVRYVNSGEEKLRVLEIHTDSESLDELFEELGQFSDARIISIRNQSFKAERGKKKRK